jgi:hypothetical protein
VARAHSGAPRVEGTRGAEVFACQLHNLGNGCGDWRGVALLGRL